MKTIKPYNGIITPMITPLLNNNRLDVEGLERLVEHIIAGGVHGLFILGTTGEGPSIHYKLRHELIRRVCHQVNERIPVMVGITDTSFNDSLELAAVAAQHGVSAVVSAPPYYFAPAQQELIETYIDLANALPLPLFLYNMPLQTKVNFDVTTMRELSEHRNVIGIKDSSCSMLYFQSLLYAFRDRPDFPILIGPEEMMAMAVMQGGHGGVNGGSNLFPSLYVEMYHAAVAKDIQRVEQLQQHIMDISSLIYKVGNYGSSLIKGIKCSLNIMGICSDEMAQPFRKFSGRYRDVIRENLLRLNTLYPPGV